MCAVEMTQQLRAIAAPAEDSGLVTQIYSSLPLSVTPVSRDPTPDSGLHRHPALKWYTDIEAGKIPYT